MDKREQQVKDWLETVVIGLELCPFANKPLMNNQIRYVISEAITEEILLEELLSELELMDKTPASELETTLLVIPDMLQSFSDYNQFLDLSDTLLEKFNWSGKFQIASFHPGYQFSETEADDPENLINRAPYPILHLLREASIEKALENYTEPSQIPLRNIKRMKKLTTAEKKKIFNYLQYGE